MCVKLCTQAKEKSAWQNKISEKHLSLYAGGCIDEHLEIQPCMWNQFCAACCCTIRIFNYNM